MGSAAAPPQRQIRARQPPALLEMPASPDKLLSFSASAAFRSLRAYATQEYQILRHFALSRAPQPASVIDHGAGCAHSPLWFPDHGPLLKRGKSGCEQNRMLALRVSPPPAEERGYLPLRHRGETRGAPLGEERRFHRPVHPEAGAGIFFLRKGSDPRRSASAWSRATSLS